MKKHDLGTFETNGTILATDPCYSSEDLWCHIPAKKGVWNAQTLEVDCGDWGSRISDLVIWHESGKEPGLFRGGIVTDNVGVDSGQAGFFDSSLKIGEGKYDDSEGFYGKCCNITLKNKESSGVVDGRGVVSSSGIGDGCYRVLGKKERGLYTVLRLEFLYGFYKAAHTPLEKLPLLIGKYGDNDVDRLIHQRIKDGH